VGGGTGDGCVGNPKDLNGYVNQHERTQHYPAVPIDPKFLFIHDRLHV